MEYRYADIGRVTGIAAPYNQWAQVGFVRERILPGAFSDALDAPLVARWAHDPEVPIGNAERGTMRVWDSPSGLRYEIALPDTQAGRDILALVERGEMGASIGFMDEQSVKQEADGDREYSKVDLREISLTANPAYKGTTARLREPTTPQDKARLQWVSANV